MRLRILKATGSLLLFSILNPHCTVANLDCRTEDPGCDAAAFFYMLSYTGVIGPNLPTGQVYIFASNALHPGNRGDRSATSFSCFSERTTYKNFLPCTNDLAFLSYSGDALLNAPSNHSVPTGLPIFADGGDQIDTSWAALFDGSINQSLDAAGVGSVGTNYWTGTDVDGSTTINNCSEWMDSAVGSNGTAGTETATDGNWINTESPVCNGSNLRHFLCVCW
ncbi:MAG TPA: hypothetical protein DEA96_06500 [Leptospiraceae bacterium]|nr:hypothetical protein [Leptospiraceae bacterium]